MGNILIPIYNLYLFKHKNIKFIDYKVDYELNI